jgi:uncharacterized protein
MDCLEHGVRTGSTAYGLGVFSTRWFDRRELIGPVLGRVIDDPQYESDYCMTIGEQSVLEPEWPFRLVNHSCQPNCRLCTDASGQLWLRVLHEIEPQEQLTIDYAWPAAAAMPCRCGCADCRGWIVAANQQQLLAVPGNDLAQAGI